MEETAAEAATQAAELAPVIAVYDGPQDYAIAPKAKTITEYGVRLINGRVETDWDYTLRGGDRRRRRSRRRRGRVPAGHLHPVGAVPMTAPDAGVTLGDFLLARIAEDEAEADAMMRQYRQGGDVSSRRWRRVLAECAAKRAIVARAARFVGSEPPPRPWGDDPDAADSLAWPILLELAAVYAEHPDYDQAWRL
jgi:hypothetical protein